MCIHQLLPPAQYILPLRVLVHAQDTCRRMLRLALGVVVAELGQGARRLDDGFREGHARREGDARRLDCPLATFAVAIRPGTVATQGRVGGIRIKIKGARDAAFMTRYFHVNNSVTSRERLNEPIWARMEERANACPGRCVPVLLG